MSRKTTVALLTVLVLAAPAAVAQELATSVLGNSGELYEVLSGPYEDLFPAGDELPGDHQVVALAVTRSGKHEQYLLPGTDSLRPEGSASLFYERDRGSLVILWRGGADAAELLHVVTFADGAFSEAYEIADPTLASVVSPRVVVTRDRYDVELSEGDWESIHRTILHLLWATSDGSGVDVRYSPLIFVEGVYSGWNQVVSLRDVTVDPKATTAPAGEALLTTLDLHVSESGQGVVAGFANALDGKLRVVEINVLPLELGYLGEEIREGLSSLESSFATQDLSSFADHGRLEVVNTGRRHRMHPALVDYMAEEVAREILIVGSRYTVASFDELVEHLRTFTLETAAPLVSASPSYARAAGGSVILEVDVAALNLAATGPAPLINLRVLRALEPPSIAPRPQGTRLFASSDGRHVLVSWEEGAGRLGYVENEAGGWSQPRSLVLGDPLSAESAYEVLERRVR